MNNKIMILRRYVPNPIYFRFDLDTGIKQNPIDIH